jgi:hypothetical protein
MRIYIPGTKHLGRHKMDEAKKHTRASLVLFVFLTLCICTEASSSGEVCKADANHKIKICFQPAQFLRCKRHIRAPFFADFFDWTHHHFYTVNIYKGERKRENLRSSFTSPIQLAPRQLPKDLHDLPIDRENDYASNGDYIVDIEVEDSDSHVKHTESQIVPVHYGRHVRAVLVGVSNYKNGASKPTPELPITNLNFAAADATAFRDFLSEFFPQSEEEVFTARLLTEADATAGNIKTELQNARKPDEACEGDLFIFYFSGHTFASTDSSIRWLGTWDIDPKPDELAVNGFRYDDLFDSYLASNYIKADKIIIFDSCFSGLKSTVPTEEGATKAEVIQGEITSSDEGKLEVVDITGRLRRDVSPLRPGSAEKEQAMQYVLKLGPSAALFTATNIDRPAQEGIVTKVPEDGRSFFFLDERGKDQNSKGHGLFTYALFVSLEKQMPAELHHSDFAGDGLASTYASAAEGCELNFTAAYIKALGFIDQMHKVRNRPVQQPDTWASQDPGPIRCAKRNQYY